MRGRIVQATTKFAGTSTVGSEDAGQTVISLDNVIDFAMPQGALVIDGDVYFYTSVDRDASTLTLSTPLAATLPPGSEVKSFPYATQRWAFVYPDSEDADTDAVWALVPHTLRAFLAPDGLRQPEDQEQVEVSRYGTRLAVTDVFNREPSLDASAIPEGSITETKIAPESITTPLLAANAVATQHLQAGAVQAEHFTGDSFTGVTFTGAKFRTNATGERMELNTDATKASRVRFYSGVPEETVPGSISMSTANGEMNISSAQRSDLSASWASMLTLHPQVAALRSYSNAEMYTTKPENTGHFRLGTSSVSSSDPNANVAVRSQVLGKDLVLESSGKVTVRPGPISSGGKFVVHDQTGNVMLEIDSNGVRIKDAGRLGSVGDLKMSAANASSLGSDWMECNGTEISRAAYPELFAVIGTLYGAGNGSTTFAIPDFRGRSPLGVGQAVANGATNHPIGQRGGEETHTLSIPEMPSHTHTQNAHGHTVYNVGSGAGAVVGSASYLTAAGGSFYSIGGTVYPAGILDNTATNQNTGGSGAHNTMHPYQTVRFYVRIRN